MPEQPMSRERRTRSMGAAVGLALAVGLASATLAPTALGAAATDAVGDPGVVELVPGEQGPEAPTPGQLDLGLILAVVAAVVVTAAVVLGVGLLFLRRRARAPLQTPPGSPDSGEWWTCANCGRNNIVGSARCYACGAWQR